MLLAVDIGNSNIVWGLYEQQSLQGHWRVARPMPLGRRTNTACCFADSLRRKAFTNLTLRAPFFPAWYRPSRIRSRK